MPLIHPIQTIFFSFFVFLLNNDVYFENTQRYQKMTVKKLRDFIYKNYYKQESFNKENTETSLFNLFIDTSEKKLKSFSKKPKLIFQKPRTLEKSNIVDIKASYYKTCKNFS